MPRVKGAGLGDTERPVLAVSTGPTGFEGEGFPVPGVSRVLVGFILHLHALGREGGYQFLNDDILNCHKA